MSPRQLVDSAEGKLDTVVVCDHNEIKGALEAREIAVRENRKLIVELGIEFSTQFGEIGAKFLSDSEAERLMALKGGSGTFGFGDLKTALNDIRGNSDSRTLVDLHHPYDVINPKRGFNLMGAIAHFPNKTMEELMAFFDFTEMNTACMHPKEIRMALDLAKTFRKPIVCSTDSHFPGQIGRYFTETHCPDARDGILFDQQLKLPSPEEVNHWLSVWYRLRSKIRKTLG